MAAALVFGITCDGDTLYDSPPDDVTLPEVTIISPAPGQEYVGGRSMRIRVSARDSLGVSRVQVSWQGAMSGSFTRSYSPPRTVAEIDTTITVRDGANGRVDVNATALNRLRGSAAAPGVDVRVSAVDTVGPAVSLEPAGSVDLLEAAGAIAVRVRASDTEGGSGLSRVGVTVVAVSRTRGDTILTGRAVDFTEARGDELEVTLLVAPIEGDFNRIGEDFELRLHGFAIDAANNCAAAVSDEPERLGCIERAQSAGTYIVSAASAPLRTARIVAGQSVALPSGSDIADIVPDPARNRVYLSNRTVGRIEVLDVTTGELLPPVRVGSEPWGMALNRTGDTLIVANSGGTSLSFVSLQGTPVEHLSRRLQTLNTPLIEVGFRGDSLGAVLYDFADRPQFVAQDAQGRLLYSTLTTSAGTAGSLRIVRHMPGWQRPETQVLLGPDAVNPLPPPTTGAFTQIVVANVDSIRRDGRTDCVEIFDHQNGSPTSLLRSGCMRQDSAAMRLAALGSDIWWRDGSWNIPALSFGDTTFVAASADRSRIAFGEGSRDAGRIMLWKADSSALSNEITTTDLIGSAGERITDVHLGPDGTLGVARGTGGAYGFRRDLRLQGVARPGPAASRSGAVLHPRHPSFLTYGPVPRSDDTTLLFVDAGSSIRIYDTVHWNLRGEIPLAAPIVGPLRVSLPTADDAAFCAGEACVVARLYAVTAAGDVLTVGVRGLDIE